jgi:hypothetical protein
MSTGTCLALLHSALQRDHTHMDGVSLEVYPDEADVTNCYIVRCEGAEPTFDLYKDARACASLRVIGIELGLDYATRSRRLRVQVPGTTQAWSDFVATVIKIVDTEKRRQFAQLASIFSEIPVCCPWDVATVTSAMSLPVILWLTKKEVQPKAKPTEPAQQSWSKGSKGSHGDGAAGSQGKGSSQGFPGYQGSWQVPPAYQGSWPAAWGGHYYW